ncbi:MAG: exopolysaccharide biosynthesis protein [Pseudomonadota bacterium]
MGQPQPLSEAIEAIKTLGEGDTLSLGELLDAFEDRSLGVVLVIFGLIVANPITGALPFMPTIGAVAVLVTVFHAIVGDKPSFPAPQSLRKRQVARTRVRSVLERLRPVGRWVDGLMVSERLGLLADNRPARRLIAALAGLIGASMAVLGFVPGLAALPALGLILYGIALMGRDGVFALAGHTFSAATALALVYALGWLL